MTVPRSKRFSQRQHRLEALLNIALLGGLVGALSYRCGLHAPDGLLMLDGERYDVGFAGHTHGGQIALRDGTPLVMPTGPLSRPYHCGRFPVRGNGELIVSRGVGCSGVPVRINADPELVICTAQ